MLWNIFSFKTSDGLDLYGGLIEAKKSQKRNKKDAKTAVVHVHGMTAFFFEGKLIQAVAKAANSAGHDFFAFNNRGMGSVSLINKRFLGTSLEDFEGCKYDISAALTSLQKLGYEKYILVGHSTGCQKVTYYAATTKKFKIESIILLAPADDLAIQKDLLGKDFNAYLKEAEELTKNRKGDTILPPRFKTTMFSAKRFYHLFKDNSLEGDIFNYTKPIIMTGKIKQPILAVFGEKEQYTILRPKVMLEKIAATFTNKKSKTVIIPNADHSFHGEEKPLYSALRKFFTSL